MHVNNELNRFIRDDRSPVLNVLLIEDKEEDAFLTKKAFEASSVHVNLYVMHNIEHMFQFLRNETTSIVFPRPDLILLDVILPKVSGLSVLRQIKRDPALSDIPVVMLTDNTYSQDIIASYKEYASGYILKPFVFELFEQTLDICARYWANAVVLPQRHSEMEDIRSKS